jgi:D-alanine-D-alanine ligase
VNVVVLHGADALEPPADPVIEEVAAALAVGGHEASTLPVGNSIEPVIAELKRRAPDLVFNLTESFRDISSLDSNLAALLNLLGLRYTGSSPSGLMLAGDKSLTKKVLRFHGIATPEFATLYRGALEHAGELRFPVIVKPPQQDASIGISESSVVEDLTTLLRRIDEMQEQYRSPVLVEELIPGREFYVGVLGNAHAEALPVMELSFEQTQENPHRIASFDLKWAPHRDAETRSVFPADLPPALVATMQKIALESFHTLRLRDYARIDMRVTPNDDVFVIEANPNCYLARASEFARAAQRHGIEYDALVARIVELAAARYAH